MSETKIAFRNIHNYINIGPNVNIVVNISELNLEGLKKNEKLALKKRAKYFILQDAQLHYVGGS